MPQRVLSFHISSTIHKHGVCAGHVDGPAESNQAMIIVEPRNPRCPSRKGLKEENWQAQKP